jgi:enolase-phosphatase E1
LNEINPAMMESEPSATVLHSDAVCILMDIEGTTSSIEFVYDILFPYVRTNVSDYLRQHWSEKETQDAIDSLGKDLDYAGSELWFADALGGVQEPSVQQKVVIEQVNKLMDQDIKATGLKKLQGLIWDVGYKNGTLRSHVYDDVPTALRAWKASGKDLRIYSSGSVHAQKVFFEHTAYGALVELLNAHYDTNIGAKKDNASYNAISQNAGIPPEKILFLSDTPAELDAARAAGMQVCLICRSDNKTKPSYIPAIENFLQIEF